MRPVVPVFRRVLAGGQPSPGAPALAGPGTLTEERRHGVSGDTVEANASARMAPVRAVSVAPTSTFDLSPHLTTSSWQVLRHVS